MKKVGWIVLGGVLAASVACAQQASSPATSSLAAGQPQATEPGPPAHPATEDQIREYLSLIRADKIAHEAMDANIRAMQVTSAPYFPASLWTDMRAEVQKLDITAVYVQVYQRYMSQSDMQAVIDFYRSPAGQKLLEAQPFAIRDAQVILRKKGEEIGQTVFARHKDEIDAAKKQFESRQSKPAIDLGPPSNSTTK